MLQPVIGQPEFLQGGHQRFRHETPAVITEIARSSGTTFPFPGPAFLTAA
jgi:hypothetical protein